MTQRSVVFAKELREGLRDRRSIVAALAATLAGPLIIGIVVTMLASDRVSSGPMEVAGRGRGAGTGPRCRASAPSRSWSCPRRRIWKAEVRAGRLDVGLVIPDDYQAKYGAVRTATVRCRLGSDAGRLARCRAARS